MRKVSFQIVMRIYQKRIHDKTLHVADRIHIFWQFQVNWVSDFKWAQLYMLQLLMEAKRVYFILGSWAGQSGYSKDWPHGPTGCIKASTTSVKGGCYPFWSTPVCFNSKLADLLQAKSDYLNCSIQFCPRHMRQYLHELLNRQIADAWQCKLQKRAVTSSG